MSHLLKIDELIIGEHASLSPNDHCYYLMEYTARSGFGYSKSNDLMYNLKKPMSMKGSSGWHYKSKAIIECGELMKEAIPQVIDTAKATFIPIPPSKIKGDPFYDGRVNEILQLACPYPADVRELIICNESREAAHLASQGERPSVAQLLSNMRINNTLLSTPIMESVVIFDDMITGGNHFKACQQLVKQQFPHVSIIGIFIARRELSSASNGFCE